jgi:hypothetical protein
VADYTLSPRPTLFIRRRGHVYSTNKKTRIDLADKVKIEKKYLYGMNSEDKIKMNVS